MNFIELNFSENSFAKYCVFEAGLSEYCLFECDLFEASSLKMAA